MTIERKPVEYLDPQEQLRVSALVNRLCELDSREFDENIHLSEAREIVRALDPKVQTNKSILRFSATGKNESSSSVLKGTTDLGDASVSFEDKERKQFEFSIRDFLEYRIGAYVAVKRETRSNFFLAFEHFWSRGAVNSLFDEEGPLTEITYRKGSLDLVSVERLIPKIRRFGRICLVTYEEVIMWKEK